MLSLQITKRKETRTVYIPFAPYWAAKDATELAQAEAKARAFYKPANFRFVGDRTIYTRGEVTVYFGVDGYAFEGYSYDACMFAFAPPSEDYPQGRVIWNDTSYSVTTNGKHRHLLMAFARGPATSQREVTEYYGMGEYRDAFTYTQYVHSQWQTRCEVHNLPWRCTGDTLRNEIVTWFCAGVAAIEAQSLYARLREQRALARRNKSLAAGKHLRLLKEAV